MQSVRSRLSVAFISCLALGSLTGDLRAQGTDEWDPGRLQSTRADLEALLSRYQQVENSSGYSAALRRQAQAEEQQVRERLQQGDMQEGDRLVLTVEGQTQLSDTFTVSTGRMLVLPIVGSIPLQGVLRSELTDYLTKKLSAYILSPVVRTQTLLRISLSGEVQRPGFETVQSQMPLSDLLMTAGGPTRLAKLSGMHIMRNGVVLLDGPRTNDALRTGKTLDQLNLRGGDEIVVPSRSNPWGTVGRISVVLIPVLTALFFRYR